MPTSFAQLLQTFLVDRLSCGVDLAILDRHDGEGPAGDVALGIPGVMSAGGIQRHRLRFVDQRLARRAGLESGLEEKEEIVRKDGDLTRQGAAILLAEGAHE